MATMSFCWVRKLHLENLSAFDAPYYPRGNAKHHPHGCPVLVDVSSRHGSARFLPVRLEDALVLEAEQLPAWLPAYSTRPGDTSKGEPAVVQQYIVLFGVVLEYARARDEAALLSPWTQGPRQGRLPQVRVRAATRRVAFEMVDVVDVLHLTHVCTLARDDRAWSLSMATRVNLAGGRAFLAKGVCGPHWRCSRHHDPLCRGRACNEARQTPGAWYKVWHHELARPDLWNLHGRHSGLRRRSTSTYHFRREMVRDAFTVVREAELRRQRATRGRGWVG